MKRDCIFYRRALICCLFILSFLHCGKGNNLSRLDNNSVAVGYIGDELIFLQDYWDMEATYLLFLPLAALERDEYGEPQPVLAERWEHSEDYRNWTFFLRKDVRWHDREPVTAHDIKFTLDLRNTKIVAQGIEPPYIVKIIDDFTVTVTYKRPTDGLDTHGVYYPKHLLENLDPDKFLEWDFWKQPVGNGPYEYVRHVPKVMVEVEANPDYYCGKPKIEKVILKFLNQQSHLVELLSGNVDAISYVSRDLLLKLSGDDRFRFYHWWGGAIETIYWNHRNPLFSSPLIRKALTMAINRRELGEVLNYPESVPIMDAITTRRQFRQGLYPEPYPYDPNKARQLFDEAGWKDIDGDGILKRNGKEFRFTAIVNNDDENERIAIYVQDQLRKIGVQMEIQLLNRSIMLQRLSKGEFDAIINLTANSTTQPNFGHITFYGKDSPLGYDNAEMNRLLNLARITIDQDEKDKVYEKIMPIFYEDLPVTLLLPSVQTHIAHKRINGLITPYRPDPVWFMESLWIEEEKR
jgi:peptide/nickel transport system substrate-binding protein